jgi:hypothetical protein
MPVSGETVVFKYSHSPDVKGERISNPGLDAQIQVNQIEVLDSLEEGISPMTSRIAGKQA